MAAFISSQMLGLLLALILTGGGGAEAAKRRGLFREYIGAEFKGVKFSDVPINPSVDFHFILSFAIDYTPTPSSNGQHLPTNGRFTAFWDTANLSPSAVLSAKSLHPNARFALSLGGDTVGSQPAYFSPVNADSWVANAVDSLSSIISLYHLDGLDVDYEHFQAEPAVFADCIGRLVAELKRRRVISFASIAPFDDPTVQSHYLELWSRHGAAFDYVNFQFYAYAKGTTVDQFLAHFHEQSRKYAGGKVVVSFSTDDSGGLKPANGFFRACEELKKANELNGIFVWSADDSKKDGFIYERQAQALLAAA
ncbi:Chitinase 2 [Nymphaea thermarum]|nr:Chitinase 2 [Nymphaea thermarum]